MDALKRKEDWPERLAEYLDAREFAPFRWGLNDCGLFAADAILEMTGVDVAANVRGKYTNCSTALRLIRGIESFTERVATFYGLDEIAPREAWRGDLVLIQSLATNDVAAGIIGMLGLPVCVGVEGMHMQPPDSVLRAWRIP